MIATNILYFSFCSARWVWAVDTVLDSALDSPLSWALDSALNSRDVATIAMFQSRTDTPEYNWAALFDITEEHILDDYFSSYFEKLWKDVDNHINNMNLDAKTILHDETLENLLDGFPKNIYLMRYSNLTLLKGIKRARRIAAHQTPLAVINNLFVHNVAAQYRLQKGQAVRINHSINQDHAPRTGYMRYMEDVAVLYSMNETMLGIGMHHLDHLSRLNRYQTMTDQAEKTMIRLMRIATPQPYEATVCQMEAAINFLYSESQITGYQSYEIGSHIEQLVPYILAAILLYAGGASGAGHESLSRLIQDQRTVRHVLHVDNQNDGIPGYYQELLTSLAAVVNNIPRVYLAVHPWVSKIQPMLGKLMWMGNGRVTP